MSLNCYYCNKEFLNKYTLKTHTETAEYCLLKRLKYEISNINIFQCSFCMKELSTKQSLMRHYSSCKARISAILKEKEELEKENEILKAKEEVYKSELEANKKLINDISSKPNVTNNSNVTNIYNISILNLSDERINEHIKHFKERNFLKGQVGVAEWASGLLKNPDGTYNYLCTDVSRRNFAFKNEKGEIIRDIHAEKLKNKIKATLIKKSKELFIKIHNKMLNKIENEEDTDDILYNNEEELNRLYKCLNDIEHLGTKFENRLIEIIT